MPIGVTVGAITINNQNTNSTVAIGQNQLPGWSAHRKVNNGLGFQAGIIINMASGANVNDFDVLDGQMNNITTNPSLQGQTL